MFKGNDSRPSDKTPFYYIPLQIKLILVEKVGSYQQNDTKLGHNLFYYLFCYIAKQTKLRKEQKCITQFNVVVKKFVCIIFSYCCRTGQGENFTSLTILSNDV